MTVCAASSATTALLSSRRCHDVSGHDGCVLGKILCDKRGMVVEMTLRREGGTLKSPIRLIDRACRIPGNLDLFG